MWGYDTSQDEDIYEAYKAVRNAGVSLFDTADSYGTLKLNGRAEILLGQFERRYIDEKSQKLLETSNGLGNLLTATSKLFSPNKSASSTIRPQQIATKFAPYPWRITRKSMLNAAKDSLKRIEQDKLAIAQLHWSTANYQPFQEKALWDGIADVYDEGLCEAVGVSNYGPKQLCKFSERMIERGAPLASAQIQYSLMTTDASKDALDACNEVGCRLISYSPLCLGLLTGKYSCEKNILPAQGPRRQLFKELLPGAKPLLDTLQAVAKEKNKTMSQVAINWTIAKGGVPIPGCKNLQQAKENLGAIDFKLSSSEVIELDVAASKVTKPMIQNIFQTD